MVYFIPWGDQNTASSRLRVFKVAPLLGAKIIPSGTAIEYTKDDILVIQKALAFKDMKKAKLAGAKVIYDIDDNYLDHQEFRFMVDQADLVTVGSSYFKQFIPNSLVIDDCLDWDGMMKIDTTPKKLVGWHGYGNLGYLFGISDSLIKRGYSIRAIVQEKFIHHYKQFDHYVWNLQTIDGLLVACDFTAFYLPDDAFSQAKGMNKLIKSWAIGLPCFVSPMPEYQRVMQEAEVDGFIVTDWDTHDLSQPWHPNMRDYALRFKPENVAKQWEKALEMVS